MKSEKKNKKLLSAVLLLSALSLSVVSCTKQGPVKNINNKVPQLTETTAERDARIQWFRDAKLGLFIHWGPAAICGKEISWSMKDRIEGGDSLKTVERDYYMNLFREFNPVNFDPDDIMKLAKNAGMKYSVFVTKHHDGFSLWDTKEKHFPEDSEFPVSYSIMDTPYKKDIVKMVGDAARKHGLKTGWYYSTRDWTHPDYLKGDNAAYNNYYENQVEELMANYGPVDILWFDHCFGDWDQYTIGSLYKKMYSYNPNLLVNNRAVRGLKNVPKEAQSLQNGDYDTPENRMGSFQAGRAWESCMILSPHVDHGGWSYRPDAVTRTLTETIRLFSSCITGDGNMLLNIAPQPDGSIRPKERAILEGLAPWMAKNKEAVYGTRGGPWINGSWGGSTYKGRTVYLHMIDPTDEGIELNRLPQNVVSVTTMDGKKITFDQDENKGTVKMVIPKAFRDQHVTIVKLSLDREVEGVQYGAALANELEEVVPGTLVFRPEDATIDGVATIRGKGADAAIVDWNDKQTKIRWTLELNSPGTYTVELVASTSEIDASLMVVAGRGRHRHAPIPVTGGVDSFQRIVVGKLEFPNAERMQLVLQSLGHKDWKPINIREVRLIPSN